MLESYAVKARGILAGLFLGMCAGPQLFAAAPPNPPEVRAKAAELIDVSSGKVLFSVHAREQLPMASLTKIMTLYIALKAVEQRKVQLNEPVLISEDASRVNGSQIWLRPGEHLSVDHLIRGVAIASANDAAYALAEFLAGSEPSFVAEMNRTAAQLGMDHTHFSNPHGLHLADHYTTAEDMATLARAAVRLPLLLHYTAMWEDRSVRDGRGGRLWLINHNRLLRQYPGTDGIKTGYTSQAGFCMVASAHRGTMRLAAVILGAPSSSVRFKDAALLMSWGFAHFQTLQIVRPNQSVGAVAVHHGVAPTVEAVIPKGLAVTVARAPGSGIRVRVELQNHLEAPVTRGQVVGTVGIYQGATRVDQHALYAQETVAKSRLPGRVWHYLIKLVG